MSESNAQSPVESDVPTRHAGHRVVLALYGIVVAIGTGMGFLIGVIHPENLDPELFGLLQLPPTPLGMAVYGGLTLTVLLGVLLLLVRTVSKRYDTA